MARLFWPEQKEEVREIAKQERKLLAMQYDASTDCDGLMAITQEEFQKLKKEKFNNPYAGWITIIEDYTEATGRAWEVLEAVNKKFRSQEADEQVLDILNEFPEAGLKVEEITPDFIRYMENSGHEILYRLPSDEYPTAYFVVTSKVYLKCENDAMFAAEAAMM